MENRMAQLEKDNTRYDERIKNLNKDVGVYQTTAKEIFNKLNSIQSCVDSMPHTVGAKISECRNEMEKTMHTHVKEGYVRKENALLPKHVYWAALIISAVVAFTAFIQNNRNDDNNAVSEIVDMVQQGKIVIPKTN